MEFLSANWICLLILVTQSDVIVQSSTPIRHKEQIRFIPNCKLCPKELLALQLVGQDMEIPSGVASSCQMSRSMIQQDRTTRVGPCQDTQSFVGTLTLRNIGHTGEALLAEAN